MALQWDGVKTRSFKTRSTRIGIIKPRFYLFEQLIFGQYYGRERLHFFRKFYRRADENILPVRKKLG